MGDAAERSLKRVPLNMRSTQAIRDKLETAAAASGRSLVQEVEYRLEKSFDRDRVATFIASGSVNRQLIQVIARTIDSLKKRAADKGWSEIQIRQALREAFKVIAEISFWTGDETSGPPDGHAVHGAPRRETSPEHDGHESAEAAMIWSHAMDDDCVLMDDFGDVITDHWSGRGTVTVDAPNPINPPPPARSLEDIMAEVNPRDRPKYRTKRKAE